MYVMQRFLQPHLLKKLGLNFSIIGRQRLAKLFLLLEIILEGIRSMTFQPPCIVYTERPQAGEVLILSKVTELGHQAIKVGQFKLCYPSLVLSMYNSIFEESLSTRLSLEIQR